MSRAIAGAALLALCGTALPGCVAVAIPALAGTALAGSDTIRGLDKKAEGKSDEPAPAAAQASEAVPAQTPDPTPMTAAAEPQPKASPPAPRPDPAPPVERPLAPLPAAFPDPAAPLKPEQASFARFVRYGQSAARQAAEGTEVPSATLSDAVSLDGKRRRCARGEQLVAVIDLDPAGSVFAPPAAPAKDPGLALGLSVLREAGVEIAWFSDLPTEQSGAVRTALEQSGLDPRGQDIVSLRREDGDDKDQRRASLGSITCILAIAGDERADFDLRFRYLRNPDAGMALETVIGDGWFLIPPLLGE